MEFTTFEKYLPSWALMIAAVIGVGTLLWKMVLPNVRELARWRSFADREERRMQLLRQWLELQKVRKELGLPLEEHTLTPARFHDEKPTSDQEATADELRGAIWKHIPVILTTTAVLALAVGLSISAVEDAKTNFDRIRDGIVLALLASSGMWIAGWVAAVMPLGRNRRGWLFLFRSACGWAAVVLLFAAYVVGSVQKVETERARASSAQAAAVAPGK